MFCFRFALDFFEIVISHTRTLWHQFSFARRYFPFLGILYFFWHRFLKIISLISVSRLLQVSYLPGYGLWCKPWYCAALSSRNTFESNCFNICKLYIYMLLHLNQLDHLDSFGARLDFASKLRSKEEITIGVTHQRRKVRA